MVEGAGGPRAGKSGDGIIRTGGRVPGAPRRSSPTLHDGHGRTFVNHVVDERGCSVMLKRSEPDGA